MLVDLLRRRHIFLIALGNLCPVRLHHKPMREHLFVRRLPGHSQARQQGELKPSAMLIGPFEIKVGWEF